MRTAAITPRILQALIAVCMVLGVAGPVAAQQPKVRIAAARVGLPPSGRVTDRGNDPQPSHICKFAAWAPVYVSLEVLDSIPGPAELVIETPDPDGINTTLTFPLALVDIKPGQTVTSRELGTLPYVRPAGEGGETTVTVRSANGTALSDPVRISTLRPKEPSTYLVLGVGSKLPGFDLPKPAMGTGETDTNTSDLLRGGRVELAAITEVDMLPDQWIGYDAVDLLVLTTGSDSFINRLFGDSGSALDKVKRAALLEWVRRGGRVVVSVGINADIVAQTPALVDFLPCTFGSPERARRVPQLGFYWAARETSQTAVQSGSLAIKGGLVTAANLVAKPIQPGRVVIPPPSRKGGDTDTIAVQGSYGLGRVTLIGFDLDRPPLTDLGNRAEFWDWVLRECGASRASYGPEGKSRTGYAGLTDEEDEFALALRTHLDTFDGVPVIPFGWVAVFIGLYILLIGPIEYYILKRVLGRLELTWITFPIIVLTISAVAYFSAVALKGRDLRVNKVDVVDVVPQTGERNGKPGGWVYGTTWFSIFSPRIDGYTIGVTPAEGWTTAGDPTPSLVGWVGGPRSGRASLLRRRYSYHTDSNTGATADGLIDVPVQVWSTKSFTARWSGGIDPTAPVVESHLLHPQADPSRVTGTFVNRMPCDQLNDCVAFYAGQVYPLGTITHGQTVRLVLDRGLPPTQFLQEQARLNEVLGRVALVGAAGRGAATSDSPILPNQPLPLWGLLFHEASLRNDEGVIPRNASLRRFDQSWRLTPENRDEVIVVGRVISHSGPAAKTIGGADSPSRLWLKSLPEPGKAPPSITGTGRQETYVRLFLPVSGSKRP